MTALLRFDDVSLRRGGRLLFEGLDLRLEPGERLHVLGPNGSGKTSLLRLAAGLLRAERGKVTSPAAALADEHVALDRELPLMAALGFWSRTDAERERLGSAMAALDLDGLKPVPVRMLSAGQLKRATLARVASSAAPLWLVDEPANGLDVRGLRDLGALIDAHVATGGAVVAASHVALPGDWRRLELGG